MKTFIYKLLSKSLLIIIVLALVAVYHYRSELFPHWFPVQPVAVKQVPADVVKPASSPVAAAVDAPAQKAELEPVTEITAPANTLPGNANVEIVVVTVAEEGAKAFAPVDSAPAEKTVTPVALANNAEPPRFAPEPEPVAPIEPMPAAVSADASSDKDALLAQARDAYWTGDYDTAELVYRQAIESDVTDPDPYGELGNILFALGKKDEAADFFLQAGQRLIAQDRGEEARHLLLVLRGLNEAHAATLEQALPAKQ